MRRPRIPPRSSYEHLIFKPGEAPELPPAPAPSSGPDVEDAGDHLIIRNIECTDADGNVYERHDELWMPKDVVQTDEIDEHGNKKPKWFTPYNAINHFDEQGDDFLPPVPVTLNILIKLFDAAVEKQDDGSYVTIDEEAKKVLDRYKDHGSGYGWHAQNTVVPYGSSKVVHYPKKADFTSGGGSVDINDGRDSIRLSFDKSELHDCLLTDGIKENGIERFARQFTGVADLERLVELGEYYSWLSGKSKPTKLWFPWSGRNGGSFNGTRAAWVGCNSDNFILSSNYDLDDDYAASGVQKNA